MVTTSPFCTTLTKLEKLVFASNMVAEIIAASSCQFILTNFSDDFNFLLAHADAQRFHLAVEVAAFQTQ